MNISYSQATKKQLINNVIREAGLLMSVNTNSAPGSNLSTTPGQNPILPLRPVFFFKKNQTSGATIKLPIGITIDDVEKEIEKRTVIVNFEEEGAELCPGVKNGRGIFLELTPRIIQGWPTPKERDEKSVREKEKEEIDIKTDIEGDSDITVSVKNCDIPETIFFKLHPHKPYYKPVSKEYFDAMLKGAIEHIKRTLILKGDEYSTQSDRLHNFTRAAMKRAASDGKLYSREESIVWMSLKHEVSIEDIIQKVKNGELVSNQMIEEKLGDKINYDILLLISLYASNDEIRERQNIKLHKPVGFPPKEEEKKKKSDTQEYHKTAVDNGFGLREFRWKKKQMNMLYDELEKEIKNKVYDPPDGTVFDALDLNKTEGANNV